MALHLAVMRRLNHFKAININRENDFRVGSVNQCMVRDTTVRISYFTAKKYCWSTFAPLDLLKIIATAEQITKLKLLDIKL